MNLGTTLELEAILGADLNVIDIVLKPEILKHFGYNVSAEWLTKDAKTNVQMPTFYKLRINTAITLHKGQFTLVGTYSLEVGGKPGDSKTTFICKSKRSESR